MKPWDEGADDLDYDEQDVLWNNVVPSDFIFATHDDGTGGNLVVIITPAYSFKEEQCMFDGALQIDHLLPEDWDELMEGHYECADFYSHKEIMDIFTEKGFVFDPDFQEFNYSFDD